MEVVKEEFLGLLESCESDFLKAGNGISRLSHWNPPYSVSDKIQDIYSKFRFHNGIEYIFGYDIREDLNGSVCNALGVEVGSVALSYTNSGTASIYKLVSMLRKKGISNVVLACPTYFSVPHACDDLGVNYRLEYLIRDESGFHFPKKPNPNSGDALWITNPVYCASIYYDDVFLEHIKNYLEAGGTVVIDESLAEHGKELVGKFFSYRNFYSICTPHKSIFINSEKFSVIVGGSNDKLLFTAWSDIITGCLSSSAYKGIQHFCSDNYQEITNFVKGVCAENRSKIEKLCLENGVLYDKCGQGALMTLYFPGIVNNYFEEKGKLKNIMTKSNCSFISGFNNYFDPELGFNFRINLSRIDNFLLDDLERFLEILCNMVRNKEV